VARDQTGNALFQDSLFSDGASLPVGTDTLRATGSVTGRLKVQPQDSPRIAWLEVLGAGLYANVDDSGKFRIDGVPAGRFTLAALTRNTDYTPTFAKVRVKTDSTTDVGTIELIYTGLPVVKNLQARFDTLAGLVYLQWDSIALRTTWRYKVYRDDILLGQTIGCRWIDTVSRELPANVPAQGKHTYRVVVADAQKDGPPWESITMQVISAMLYQELRFDWRKMSSLPWVGGLYRIDTAGSELVCWRSPLDSVSNVQMWVSLDSGRTWTLRKDSLSLRALPVRFGGAWWTVKEMPAADSVGVWKSLEGSSWAPVSSLPRVAGTNDWWLDLEESTIAVVDGCDHADCGSVIQQYYDVAGGWRWTGTGFDAVTSLDSIGSLQAGVGNFKRGWSDGGWWSISDFGQTEYIQVDGIQARYGTGSYPSAFTKSALEMGYFLFKTGDRYAVFSSRTAWSIDSTGTEVHSISWPGTGPHYEIRYGGGILSVSDAGVYLGTIQTDPPSDPRGTWVKQTLVPVVF
jgi:hypothetical protein